VLLTSSYLLTGSAQPGRRPAREQCRPARTAARADILRQLQLRHADCSIHIALLEVRAIMSYMTYCDLCELDREFCEHGLAERRRNAATVASGLLISPNGIAHFPGCPHKGDDRDYSRWAELDTRHVPGNVWGTASSCKPQAGRVLA